MARVDVADLGRGGLEPPQEAGRSFVVSEAWPLAIVVTVAATLVRLFVAATTPLFPDESYYWEFSRRLAGGYFDHPPVIAWLVKFGTLLFGDTSLGVRFGAVLAGGGAALFTTAAARRLGGSRGALIAAAVFALVPLSTGLTLATPDAPLLCFVAATLYVLVRVNEAPSRTRESFAWWCVAGGTLGLAVGSKYTGALIGLTVFAGMVAIPELRHRLREPGPYVATGIALAMFSPVIMWNATHDWASFAFQLDHGLAPVGGSALMRELELFGGQLALLSPILFVLVATACVTAVRVATHDRSELSVTRGLLAIVAILVFAFFVYSATKRRVEPNWPALAYVAGVVVFATHASSRRWGRWSRVALTVAGFITGATYVNAFVPLLPVPARADPIARSAGWDDLAQVVEVELEQQRQANADRRLWVATNRYQEASELAFHLPGKPTTFSLNVDSRPNAYDFWPGFAELASSGDALVLVVDQVPDTAVHPAVARLGTHFASVQRGEPFAVSHNGALLREFQIWILDGWRGTWPRAVVGSRS